MLIEIRRVEAIFRYPVKSMAGERLEAAELGWHGLEGDRRLAFRRINNSSGFPWLSASQLPDLLRFTPLRRAGDAGEDAAHRGGDVRENAPGDLHLPTHIRTPDGEDLPVFGEALAAEVGRRYGAPVQMLQLRHGIFDEATISVIASATVREIGRLAGLTPDVQNPDVRTPDVQSLDVQSLDARSLGVQSLDIRRFRPNVVVRLLRPVPFQEDQWLGGVLSFGKKQKKSKNKKKADDDDAPAITVTMRDVRCSMVNLDPDSASPAPEVLKAVVRAHQNTAGIYGAVTRTGRLVVGQSVFLRAGAETPAVVSSVSKAGGPDLEGE